MTSTDRKKPPFHTVDTATAVIFAAAVVIVGCWDMGSRLYRDVQNFGIAGVLIRK